MSKTKVTGAERKAMLLEIGARLAAKHGAKNVTRRMVAKGAKVSEGLVSRYFATSAEGHKAYARKAKAMGLTLPDKAKTEAIGVKLRAHGPRDKRDTRKRSIREVEAIKRKAAAKPTFAAMKGKVRTTVRKINRSAVDGEFITAKEAKANPKTTMTETVVKKNRSLTGAVIAKKSATARAARSDSNAGERETKPVPQPRQTKPVKAPTRPAPGPAETPVAIPPEVKTAARAPKSPPPLPG